MSLINCPECNNEVSDSAKTCPKCGVRIKPRSKVLWWILGVPAGLFVIFAIIGSNNPKYEAMAKDRNAFEYCMKQLDDPLAAPAAKSALRGTCAYMRDEFIKKYGREP